MLSDEDFAAIVVEANICEDFGLLVLLAWLLLLVKLVVADWISLLGIVPEEDETLRASNGENGGGWVDSDGAD